MAGAEVGSVQVAFGLSQSESIGHVGEAGDNHLRDTDCDDVATVVVHHSESLADMFQWLLLLLYSERSPAVARLFPLTTRSTSRCRTFPGAPSSMVRSPLTNGNVMDRR